MRSLLLGLVGVVYHLCLLSARTEAFAVAPSQSRFVPRGLPSGREFSDGGVTWRGRGCGRDARSPESLRAQSRVRWEPVRWEPVRETSHQDKPAESPAPQQQQQQQQQQQGFDWRRQWYPVAVTRDLEAMDPRQPYPVKVLGEAMVVWKDPKGEWKVFADRCPHRWAPLSEGRVDQDTGRLQCIYHGWEFEANGTCGSIPQAASGMRETAQSSGRACATVIQSRVAQGLLWAWPDTSPEGVEIGRRTMPVTTPEADDDSGFVGEWYYRDLPYGYDTLVENLVDPAHVPYAHHGVLGAREIGVPMDIAMEKGLGEDVFRTQKTGFSGSKNFVVSYQAPSLVVYRADVTDRWQSLIKKRPLIRFVAWLITVLKVDKRLAMKPEERTDPSDRLYSLFIGYAVPTSPGKSRIFIRNCRNFLRRWRNSMAREHIRQHLVLDGDTPALHMQERFLLEAGKHGGASAERTFFMPADADEPIRAFRRWYNSRGGGGPTWAEGVNPKNLGPILPREQLLDRMEGHTKYCSACRKAYRVLGKVKRVSIGGALILLAAATVAPRGPLALCLVGGAMAASGLAAAMAKREQRFVFVDYVHATRDG